MYSRDTDPGTNFLHGTDGPLLCPADLLGILFQNHQRIFVCQLYQPLLLSLLGYQNTHLVATTFTEPSGDNLCIFYLIF